MGDCLNDLGMEDLKLLEEEMDKAAKVVRERKVRYLDYMFLFIHYFLLFSRKLIRVYD